MIEMKSYILVIGLGAQALHFRDTHRSSSPIFYWHPWIDDFYILAVPLGSQVVYSEGTLGSSNPIFYRCPWILES